MPELVTTVYLNNPPQFLGFGRPEPAKLYAAAGFTLTPGGRPSAGQVKVALETVFEQLNIDDPDQPWAISYRQAGHRNLSVGDVVVIGETAWARAPSGWDLLTADQLHDAIYHHSLPRRRVTPRRPAATTAFTTTRHKEIPT